MQISQLKTKEDLLYFDHNFIILLESHLTYLKTFGNAQLIPISKHQNYKYEGDLYSLLTDLNIEKKFHYLVTRINGYDSSCDFKGDKDFLLIPDLSEVDLLRSVYNTKNIF